MRAEQAEVNTPHMSGYESAACPQFLRHNDSDIFGTSLDVGKLVTIPIRHVGQAQNWYNIHNFERGEAEEAWQHQRAILVEMMWDPSAIIEAKNVSAQG